jgi:hypothetical protein
MSGAVFLPQHGQIDTGPLHLAGQRRPVGLDPSPAARLGAAGGEQPLLENRVRELSRQWPSEPRGRGSRQIFLDRTAAHPELACDRPRAGPYPVMQSQQLTYTSHGQPLCWHLLPLHSVEGVDARSMLTRGRRRPLRSEPQPTSPPGEAAGFKSERWPASSRKRWPASVGICILPTRARP